jgi:serine/threonine-protein kinase RsbW
MPPGPTRKSTRVARLGKTGRSPAIVRELRMPSRRSAIAPTVERILRIVKQAGLAEERRMDLAVALAEALSNAAVHGNQQRPGTQVSIKITVVPGRRATVEVRDSGTGFDLTALRDPTDPSHLLTPGGRGVFLMRRLVDRLVVNPPGNHVTLIVRARS